MKRQRQRSPSRDGRMSRASDEARRGEQRRRYQAHRSSPGERRRSRSPLHPVQKRGRTCSPSGSARSTAAAPGGNTTKSSHAATVEAPGVPDTAMPSPVAVVTADLKDLLDSMASPWSSPGVYLGPPEVEATTLNTPTVPGVLPISTATTTPGVATATVPPTTPAARVPAPSTSTAEPPAPSVALPSPPPVTRALWREEKKVRQQAVKGRLQPVTVQHEQAPSQRVDRDPRLWFAGAPSLEAEGFPAEELRRFREEVLKDSGIEKRVAFFPDGLTTVTKLEWAVLPDGTKYALETTWRWPNRTYVSFPPAQNTRL